MIVVVNSPLPRVGDTVQTTITVHAVNQIELGQGKDGSPFRTTRE